VTFRDPASVNDMLETLSNLLFDKRFDVLVVAQNPAYEILVDYLTLKNLDCKPILFEFSKSLKINRKKLTEIFEKFHPDILLTGISGPDFGVDEIALQAGKKYSSSLKTFSIQSYWGDINIGCKVIADNIFVIDNFAKKITLKRFPNCNIIISGCFQSKKYSMINVEYERNLFRSKNLKNYDNDVKVFGFFGQPLFEYEWYKDSISEFTNALKEIEMPHILAYKSHPKESQESIDWTINKFEQLNLDYIRINDSDILKVLSGMDVVVSLFSTVGYNLQNLLLNSNKPFSTIIYLQFNLKCREWISSYSALEKIPMTEDNMANVVLESSNLKKTILESVTQEKRNQCYSAIQKNFPSSNISATEQIIKTISSIAK